MTFQPSYRPLGALHDGKRYYSEKDGQYGLKVEVSVPPSGIAIGCSAYEPGSVSDFSFSK